jgi:hypothetical protein
VKALVAFPASCFADVEAYPNSCKAYPNIGRRCQNLGDHLKNFSRGPLLGKLLEQYFSPFYPKKALVGVLLIFD